MALDLLKNIRELTSSPIGKDDAKKLSELLDILEKQYVATSISRAVIDNARLRKEVNEARQMLEGLLGEINGKIENLEEELESKEYQPIERDQELLGTINDMKEAANKSEYDKKEEEKAKRRLKLEKTKKIVADQIAELEDLKINIEETPQFISKLCADYNKSDIQALIDAFLPSLCTGYYEIPSTINGPLFELSDEKKHFNGLIPNMENIAEYFEAVLDPEATKEAQTRAKILLDKTRQEEKIALVEKQEERIGRIEESLSQEGIQELANNLCGIIDLERELQALSKEESLPAKRSGFMGRVMSLFNRNTLKKQMKEKEEKKNEINTKIFRGMLELSEVPGKQLEGLMCTIESLDCAQGDIETRIKNIEYGQKALSTSNNHDKYEIINGLVERCVKTGEFPDIEKRRREMGKTKESLKSIKIETGKKIEQIDTIIKTPISDEAKKVIDTLGIKEAADPIVLRTRERYGLSPQAAFVGIATMAKAGKLDEYGNNEFMKKMFEGKISIPDYRIQHDTTIDNATAGVKEKEKYAKEIGKEVKNILDEI